MRQQDNLSGNEENEEASRADQDVHSCMTLQEVML